MDLSSLEGYTLAIRALDVHTTSRAKEMAMLESFVDGTQYAGLPDWFSEGPSPKPIWERAPCFVYPIVKTAIDSNADLLFGEGRFPDVTTRPCEGGDDSDVNDDGLTREESVAVDDFIEEIQGHVRFRYGCRQVLSEAQGSKSGVALWGVRSGKLFCDTVRARWCTPTFDMEGKVSSVVVEYPYLVEVFDRSRGKDVVKAMMFRRVIDQASDVTMFPAEITDKKTDISWTPDPNQTFIHGLGFCPIQWYAHMKGCTMVNRFDGHAIHQHLTDEIRAHDFAISQRHRAALYSGDPQWTETGVEPGTNPSGTGRTASVPATASGGAPGVSNPIQGRYSEINTGDTRSARKKGPGIVWQYESPDVRVQQHTLPGDALKAISDHAKDLRAKLCESLGVVFFDSEDFSRAMDISGRALEARKARQIERCDLYREDFAVGFIQPAISMLLRIVAKVGPAGGLRIKGLKEILPILTKFQEGKVWHDPSLTVRWGPYVRSSPDDELAMISSVQIAKKAGMITTRSAVEKLSSAFHIENIDAYLETLKGENEEAAKQAAQLATTVRPPPGGDGESSNPIKPKGSP